MSKSKLHFPNPPITEAVLELRAQLPEGIDLETLEKFVESVSEDYPEKRIRTKVEARLQLDQHTKDVLAEGSGSPDGFLLTSRDSLQVVQARLDGYAFSRLKPYQGWASFRTEALRLWESYRSIANPEKITRIALRYINRIDIPMSETGVDFKEYFLTGPEIATGISQDIMNFFMRVAIPDEKKRGIAIITETVDTNALTPTNFPLVFDVDAFKEGAFEPDSDKILEALDMLRSLKNEIFALTFTDKAKELFR